MRKSFAVFVAALSMAAAAFAQLTVAPIDMKERTLPNGLRVVSVQDDSSPTVSIHVWYDVGGKDDPPGRSFLSRSAPEELSRFVRTSAQQ